MSGQIDDQGLLRLYESMVLIRRAEERLSRLFAGGEIPGFVHLSLGQEAVPAGVCAVLEHADSVASTHRGHGHALAKGVRVEGFFAEIMGRSGGVCKGRGGSMHVADMSIGMLGANGIVGGGYSLALGAAFAHQVKKRPNIAVTFFGDGAMAEGALHECLNLAVLWKLPLLFVCENNGWSEFSPVSRQFAARLSDLGEAFGIGSEHADGTDVEAVFAAAKRCVARVRSGAGPYILECRTNRWHGHFEGDPQKYREASELAAARGEDPLAVTAGRLTARGIAEATLADVDARVVARIDAAVEAARADAEPDVAAAFADVYATGEIHA